MQSTETTAAGIASDTAFSGLFFAIRRTRAGHVLTNRCWKIINSTKLSDLRAGAAIADGFSEEQIWTIVL
jgi:hypothetical protein